MAGRCVRTAATAVGASAVTSLGLTGLPPGLVGGADNETACASDTGLAYYGPVPVVCIR
jgi:hypothetical protein